VLKPGGEPVLVTRREIVRGINTTLLTLGALSMAPVDVYGASPTLNRETYKVHLIENTWITMPDGVQLAARIWLPEISNRPVPAIFNYCPYFSRLFTRTEDENRFPYYASHGYACVRVDIRGSGDSGGLPLDEYVQQEQDDGVEIIKWIAAQPWCSGAVGMEGISWSGFNSLQVAARRPAALKAIITHCSTDDRYTDDAHYKGGCIIHDMFNWGTVFLAFQGQAPDPAIIATDDWRRTWLQRLKAVDFNLGNWLDHQHRDAFWKHASVIEDYSQIVCPVYAIGGWVDAYKNSIFRLLGGLKVPRKGLVGPWTHIYPHQGVPGPAIGYLDEALRWWDHWLKNLDSGIMAEPMLRVWMQDKSATPNEPSVPGRWVAEKTWPSTRMTEKIYFLSGLAKLEPSSGPEQRLVLHPLQTVGAASGNWCPSGAGAAEDLNTELPFEQRIDDARSMAFDSAPLQAPIEILGAAILTLAVAVDKPVAFIAVRLNEVLPTGESSRVSYGILNLCHRTSDEQPSALEPGRRYNVEVSLDNIARRFHAGNRIRIAISTAYWPMILPSPEPVTLTLFTGASKLTLPIRPLDEADAQLRPFAPPFVPAAAVQIVSSKPGMHIIEWDAVNKKQVIRHEVGDGVDLLTDIKTRLVGSSKMRCEIGENDTSGSIEYQYEMGWERERWRPRIVASSKIATSRTEFLLWGEIDAFDGAEKIFTRTWNKKYPRRLV
jgi:uncharacterized protein